MNEFVVTINENKNKVKVIDSSKIEYNGVVEPVEFSKINDHCYLLKIGNSVFDVTTSRLSNDKYSFFVNGHFYETTVRTALQEKATEYLKNQAKFTHNDSLKAPMPGLVVKLCKAVGDKVEQGESLVILEAMKMENDLRAPLSGVISEIFVQEGKSVEKDSVILTIK